MDLGWITPIEITESKNDYALALGSVHRIKVETSRSFIINPTTIFLLERRSHNGFGRYVSFFEFRDQDPGLLLWRRDNSERPVLIAADGRRIRDARDKPQNPVVKEYQDQLSDPFPVRAGDHDSYAQQGVDAVYAHTASTGLRQQTEGTWGESDPASLALALTDIRRRTDAGNDSLTLDVQLNYWAGTLKVGKNPGPHRIVWGDDDDENRVDTVYVGGDVTVPAGITLRIAEGTEVHFPAHTDVLDGGNDATRSELIIEGTLDAGADSITFRSADTTHPSNNDWYGIHVESGGMADLSGATIQDGVPLRAEP